jgi:hypothetical protein
MNEMAASIGVWDMGGYHILWWTFFQNGEVELYVSYIRKKVLWKF